VNNQAMLWHHKKLTTANHSETFVLRKPFAATSTQFTNLILMNVPGENMALCKVAEKICFVQRMRDHELIRIESNYLKDQSNHTCSSEES
jgi:hypothetical protein